MTAPAAVAKPAENEVPVFDSSIWLSTGLKLSLSRLRLVAAVMNPG